MYYNVHVGAAFRHTSKHMIRNTLYYTDIHNRLGCR